MFETAVQLNLLSKQINTPRSYIIAFLYLPKFFTKTKFIVLTSKTDKTFYIKVLTQFLKNWKLRNFLHNNYHNNYFLPGYPGITYIKKAKPFNDLTILRFKNLLYPSQNFLPENKIQHINGWVFKTRRPLDRIYGWSTYLSKNLYLKPLSVTLNLNSIKSIKWSLFKSFKKIEGSTKVATAKSGAVVDSGSAYYVALSNAYEAELQKKLIEYNAKIAADNKREEATFAFRDRK